MKMIDGFRNDNHNNAHKVHDPSKHSVIELPSLR